MFNFSGNIVNAQEEQQPVSLTKEEVGIKSSTCVSKLLHVRNVNYILVVIKC